jgi:nucleotide-binding universal stress UspA family protein
MTINRGRRHEMNERRILVAYDGTEEAYWALMHAADAALATGAAIGVVTVLPSLTAAATDAAEILGGHELQATVHTPTGDPATEIARVAHEHAYDAIYVGRREDGSLARALQQRVSQGVIRASARTTVIAR